MEMLEALDVATKIWPMPVEIADAIPFPDDYEHASYDADAVHRFWRLLTEVDRVMNNFRERFIGKASPIHVFWGPSTWPTPDSRGVPLHPTREGSPTAALTSCGRPTPTR